MNSFLLQHNLWYVYNSLSEFNKVNKQLFEKKKCLISFAYFSLLKVAEYQTSQFYKKA